VPEITFKEEIINQDAKELKQICPTGVYDIEDMGEYTRAFVKEPRNCTTCRECIRPDKFKDIIELKKIKDHYECNILNIYFSPC
jgi:DNA-directed RNA polymerase I and III subunit RPAC1